MKGLESSIATWFTANELWIPHQSSTINRAPNDSWSSPAQKDNHSEERFRSSYLFPYRVFESVRVGMKITVERYRRSPLSMGFPPEYMFGSPKISLWLEIPCTVEDPKTLMPKTYLFCWIVKFSPNTNFHQSGSILNLCHCYTSLKSLYNSEIKLYLKLLLYKSFMQTNTAIEKSWWSTCVNAAYVTLLY